jgi:hypothetical protein
VRSGARVDTECRLNGGSGVDEREQPTEVQESVDRGVGGTDEHEVQARDAALPVQQVKSAHPGAPERGHADEVGNDPGHPGCTEPVVEDSGQFESGQVAERPPHPQEQGAGERFLGLDHR